MTPDQIIRHFGGERQAADALGCTRQYINILKKRGKIPPKTQAWIQVRTKGELLADEESPDPPLDNPPQQAQESIDSTG